MDANSQHAGGPQNGVLQSKEEGATSTQSRIAHTLTACCRCRTVRASCAQKTPNSDVY